MDLGKYEGAMEYGKEYKEKSIEVSKIFVKSFIHFDNCYISKIECICFWFVFYMFIHVCVNSRISWNRDCNQQVSRTAACSFLQIHQQR